MKRRLLPLFFIWCAGCVALGQDVTEPDTGKPRFTDQHDMKFQLRGTFNVEKTDGNPPAGRFRMDDFRWNFEGKAEKTLYYRFRQSFTTAFQSMSLDNILSSVNYAFVRWTPVAPLSITAGKQVFAFGGHEFWAEPLYVIHFSEFGGSLNPYQLGLSAEWNYSPRQNLVLQACNLRGTGDDQYYIGGLPEGVQSADFPFIYTANWNGTFLDNGALELRYSASYANQAKGESMWVVALGQSYRKRKWGAFVDLMWSRQGLDASGILSGEARAADGTAHTMKNTEYLSAVGYVHFFISPHFEAFVKGCGEWGGLYAPHGKAENGLCRTSWNAQACFQYLPTKNRGFRCFFHYNYSGSDITGRGSRLGMKQHNGHAASLGVIYEMNVF